MSRYAYTERIVILGKKLVPTDSVQYIVQREDYFTFYPFPPYYSYSKDVYSPAYFYSDSSIFKLYPEQLDSTKTLVKDSLYNNPMQYANRLQGLVTSTTPKYGCSALCQTIKYASGLGMTDFSILSEDPGDVRSNHLLYYHKGNEVWGTPVDIISATAELKSGITDMVLYPNPVNDFVYLRSIGKGDKISVYNTLGELVLTKKVSSDVPMSVGELPNGLYVLMLSEQNQVIRRKQFLVER